MAVATGREFGLYIGGETVSVFGEVPEERSLWALGVERLASIPLDPANARISDAAPPAVYAALAERVVGLIRPADDAQ